MPACVRNSANLITTLLPSLPLFCIAAVAPQIFASYEKRRAALVWIEFFFSFFQRGKPDSKQKYLQVHFVEYSSINFTCTCLREKCSSILFTHFLFHLLFIFLFFLISMILSSIRVLLIYFGASLFFGQPCLAQLTEFRSRFFLSPCFPVC